MTWITVEEFVQLLESVILAKSVVVIGSNFEEITKTVAFIPQIMAPFSWASSIFSFIPNEMIEVFDNPFPYISGAYRTDFEQYREIRERDNSFPQGIVIINMDDQTVEFTSSSFSLPESDDFIASISALFEDDIKNKKNFSFTMTILKLTQQHIFKTITQPMEKALKCRLDLPNSGTMFNKNDYLKQFTEQNIDFIKELFDSPNFDILIGQISRANTLIQSGHSEEIGGMSKWAANIWDELNQKIVTPIKPSPAELLNVFQPAI